MIFKVSKNFKGSCVLPTLGKAIWADMSVSVGGNNLRADDIKDAVKKGILIPIDEDYEAEDFQKDHDVIIINKTEQVMVLGKITLRPLGSLPISKDKARALPIIEAAEAGNITILSDEGDESYIKIKKKSQKKQKINKKKEQFKFTISETGEDKDVTPVTWNFRTKEIEEAKKISKSEVSLDIGDTEKTKKKKTKKKKVVKKKVSAKKKTKKKEITGKSKKVKTIEPVGEKKTPKTVADAAIELDSRGNPIGEIPGETLQHLIDNLNAPKEISFVDDEQANDRYQNRNNAE